MSEISEKEIKQIIKKVQKGDIDSFGTIYEIFAERIYRYIYLKVSNKEIAEDLTQQVFIKAWEAIGDFKFKNNPFSSWLYSIARNSVTDFYRKKKPDFSLDEEIKIDLFDEKDLNEELINKEEVDNILKKIYQLPSDQKELLILRFVEDLSYEEIAKIMNKTPLNLRVIQHRALNRLKKEMDTDFNFN